MFHHLSLLIMIVLLSGCGGTNSDLSKNKEAIDNSATLLEKFSNFTSNLEEEVIYKGKREQADINSDNIEKFLSLLSNDILLSPSQVERENRTFSKSRSSTSKIEKIAGKRSGVLYIKPYKINTTLSQIDIIWENYSDSEEEGTIDGVGRYSIYYDEGGYAYKNIFKTGKLHLFNNKEDGYVSGTIESTNMGLRSTLNLIMEDTKHSQFLMIKDLKTTLYNNQKESYDGKIFISSEGYITISTLQNITFDPYEDEYQNAHFLLQGAHSNAHLILARDNLFRVELDLAHDTHYDALQIARLEDFKIVPNRGPSLREIHIDTRHDSNNTKQVYTNEDIQIYYLNAIYDPEGDGIEDINVTFLVNDKKVQEQHGTKDATLKSDNFSKHDIVKIIISARDTLGYVTTSTIPVYVINAPPRKTSYEMYIKMNYDFQSLRGGYIIKGESLALYGTNITDIDGDSLTYRWFLEAKESNNTYREIASDFFHIQDGVSPNEPQRIFTPTKAGEYRIGLEVNDGEDSSFIHNNISVKEDFGHVQKFDSLKLEESALKGSVELIDIKDIDSDGEDEFIFVKHLGINALYHDNILFVSKDLTKIEKSFTIDEMNVNRYRIQDVNGDGRLDIVSHRHFYIQDDSFSFSPFDMPFKAEFVNFDGDEKREMLKIDGCTLNFYPNIYDLSNTSTLSIPCVENSDKKQSSFFVRDLENDGKSEIIRIEKTILEKDDGYFLYSGQVDIFREEDGRFYKQSLHSAPYFSKVYNSDIAYHEIDVFTFFSNNQYLLSFYDLNHDGIEDIIHHNSDMKDIFVELSQDDGSYKLEKMDIPQSQISDYKNPFIYIDVNRDGKKDFIHHSFFSLVDHGAYYEAKQEGGFKPKTTLFYYTNKDKFDLYKDTYIPYDYDGDGFQEILFLKNELLYVLYLK